MYRILREERQLAHRGRSRPRTHRRPEALVASAPGQTWSWDITYLKSPIRGIFYYLYLIMDVWSRKIVGWEVHEQELAELAAPLVEQTCRKEGTEPDGRFTLPVHRNSYVWAVGKFGSGCYRRHAHCAHDAAGDVSSWRHRNGVV